MKILKQKDLQEEGISILAVQKSRSLNYLSREFSRKSDLPKKFLQKALDICQEIAEAGKDSFITETNYSYTIWEEEKPVASNSQQNTVATIAIPQNSSLISTEYSTNNSNKKNSHLPKMTVHVRNVPETNNSYYSKQNLVNNNSPSIDNVDIPTSQITSQETKIGNNITNNQSSKDSFATQQKKLNKKRTYRGIVY